MDLARDVYMLTRSFPRNETYGLSSQVRRAAVSVPANIAEGHARSSTKDFLRHIAIALGSLAEVETLLILAQSISCADRESFNGLLDRCAQEGRMLTALQSKLRIRCRQHPPASDL